MLQKIKASGGLLNRHLGSRNWSEISVGEQNELVKTYFKDQTGFETLVVDLDWKGDQNVGFVEVIELVRTILKKARVISEADISPSERFDISANDLLVVQVLINTQFGRRIANALDIETAGVSYDISDEELEHSATELIEVEAVCEQFLEFDCYDGAIEQILDHLYPVYSSDLAPFPPSQIQHLWKNDGGSSRFG